MVAKLFLPSHFEILKSAMNISFESVMKQKQKRALKNVYFLLTGIIEHIYPAFVDCVLLAAGRDYSSNITSGAIVRKICIVYDDP